MLFPFSTCFCVIADKSSSSSIFAVSAELLRDLDRDRQSAAGLIPLSAPRKPPNSLGRAPGEDETPLEP